MHHTTAYTEPLSSADRSKTPIVGIVGGGQLGRMLVQAAAPLGIGVRVLAEDRDGPVARIWPHTIVSPIDAASVSALAASVDIVTFEREDIPVAALTALGATQVPARPSVKTLQLTSDKRAQRRVLVDARVPVLPAIDAHDEPTVHAALRIFGYPAVLKSARGGFDGRGVQFVTSDDQVTTALAALGPGRLLVEPLLGVDAELAVLVARRPSGDARVYPVIRTVQHRGACQVAEIPARLPDTLEAHAQALALRIADLLDGVGIIAIEMFVIGGVLVVNEVAARPHNSGHLTIDACVTSQFENHLRAVLDWPLGSTDLAVAAATMANVLAVDIDTNAHDRVPEALADDRVRVHLYDKPPRPGRKVGHVTAVGTGPDETRRAALAAAGLLAGSARTIEP